LKRHLVQILVVVANTKVQCFRTEVEKGSMRTAVARGLFGPKLQINFRKSAVGRVYFPLLTVKISKREMGKDSHKNRVSLLATKNDPEYLQPWFNKNYLFFLIL